MRLRTPFELTPKGPSNALRTPSNGVCSHTPLYPRGVRTRPPGFEPRARSAAFANREHAMSALPEKTITGFQMPSADCTFDAITADLRTPTRSGTQVASRDILRFGPSPLATSALLAKNRENWEMDAPKAAKSDRQPNGRFAKGSIHNPRGRPKGYPKTGGRKPGSLNKATIAMREALRLALENPDGLKTVASNYPKTFLKLLF